MSGLEGKKGRGGGGGLEWGDEPFVAGTKVYAYSCVGACFAVAEGAAVGVDADGFGLRDS